MASAHAGGHGTAALAHAGVHALSIGRARTHVCALEREHRRHPRAAGKRSHAPSLSHVHPHTTFVASRVTFTRTRTRVRARGQPPTVKHACAQPATCGVPLHARAHTQLTGAPMLLTRARRQRHGHIHCGSSCLAHSLDTVADQGRGRACLRVCARAHARWSSATPRLPRLPRCLHRARGRDAWRCVVAPAPHNDPDSRARAHTRTRVAATDPTTPTFHDAPARTHVRTRMLTCATCNATLHLRVHTHPHTHSFKRARVLTHTHGGRVGQIALDSRPARCMPARGVALGRLGAEAQRPRRRGL